MNLKPINESNSLKADKRLNGLIYGALAGFSFALATWGWDASELAGAGAILPWVKLVAGALVTTLLGLLAGWLAARIDNTVASALLWLAVGVIFTYLAGVLPYQGVTLAQNWLTPEIAERTNYQWTGASQTRMWIALLTVALAMLFVGIFELVLIDAATTSTSFSFRWLALGACIPMTWLGGYIGADLQINKPLREPVLATHSTLEFARANEGQVIDRLLARDMRVSALRSLSNVIYGPYRLVLGSYDEFLSQVTILVDFNGAWARCITVEGNLVFCEAIDEAAKAPAGTSPIQISSAKTGGQSSSAPQPTPQTGSQSGILVPTSTAPAARTPVSLQPESQAILSIAEREVQGLTDLPVYEISAAVDFAGHSFSGQMQLAYVNTESVPLGSLYFRLFPNGGRSYGNGSLSVNRVEVDGQPVDTSVSLNDSALEVKLPGPVQPGELRNISMEFSGVVPLDYGGENTSGYGIYNFSQNVMALSGWFPILAVYDDEGWNLDPVSGIGDSVYSDMASFTVNISLTEGIILVSTGVTIDSQTVSPNLTQHTIESGPARDFFLIMSPDFQVTSQNVGKTQVNSYYLPGNERGGERVLAVGSESLRIFNQQFGLYPYVDLDLVDAPMRGAAGVEFPGIVLIGDSLYPEYTRPDLVVTTAHEVAHQWWYNLVGNDVIDDPWMDEALTTYSSSLYYEFTQGPSAAEGLFSYYENRLQQSVDTGSDDQVTRSETYFENLDDPRRYGAIVYAKGALFFRALRQEIGDEAFFSALVHYFDTHKYRIANPEDLLDAFEEASGGQLDDFYQDWLYSPDPS
jgi:hypothetical protein